MNVATSGRIDSLDAFRGFAIASMVLVNNPGDWAHLHAPLAHAEWNGWTFTDLVFPFFLFAAGMSMAVSLERRRANRQLAKFDSDPIYHIAKRAAVIFLTKRALYAPIQALPIAPENASLLFALAFNLAMFGVAWFMWKKRWFVRA